MIVSREIINKISEMYRGLYCHLKSGKLYFAEGIARHAERPGKLSVVYCQKYEGALRENGTKTPVGTMWIRDLEDFNTKFEKVDEPVKLQRLLTSFQTAAEKDLLAGYNNMIPNKWEA